LAAWAAPGLASKTRVRTPHCARTWTIPRPIVPLPTISVLGLALILVAFTLASRLLTVFPPLYAMRQGLRASMLPAINLAQMSEFSLVRGIWNFSTQAGVCDGASFS